MRQYSKAITVSLLSTLITVTAISAQKRTGDTGATTTYFGDDVAFLKKHTQVALLSDSLGEAQVAVAPAYQGRVMTSTAGGRWGTSFGWVNRGLIASGKKQPHINVYGGEDRFWIGPEGGQFSVFFAKGAKFDLEHWFTPAAVDTEPFEVVLSAKDRVLCRRNMHLVNYSGTEFDLEVTRDVRLLTEPETWVHLGTPPQREARVVAFESNNAIRNTGSRAWDKETGLLSIWILGMFNASPSTTVAIPYRKGPESELGPVVNDTYFGKVPADRLKAEDGMIFFAADANYRSKIGVSPLRSTPVLGSYDAANRVLTVVQFTLPAGGSGYVNSMWEIQKNPYGGDAINSYNDGPPAPGAKQLGSFYELETSSPALALGPNVGARHMHRTIHLQGPERSLDAVAKAVLGVGIDRIVKGLKK